MLGLALALLGSGCTEPVDRIRREGRYGSLRDLMLFERSEAGPAAALFFDRFEVTRGDWTAFAATPEGRAVDAGSALHRGEPALPAALLDLRQARAFARWRFLRLPRSDEWLFVALGDRRYRYPWGDRVDPARANTSELGLGQTTPCGTFESGRRGDQLYDLVGNVSEWTETVPASWWNERAGEARPVDPHGMRVCRARVLATPALAAWQGPGGLVPGAWLAAVGGAHVPREVRGADFQVTMEQEELVEIVRAGDRRARTGLRLCATAGELLVALGAAPGTLAPEDELQLQRFVARGRHREVLTAAWLELRDRGVVIGASAPANLLRVELGMAGGGG